MDLETVINQILEELINGDETKATNENSQMDNLSKNVIEVMFNHESLKE
ncbi:hypothetical protein JK635_21740 [Neobacillus sp. YIM B02564]|uniref:Uncharacterized protein n=1 Tax=Neobacillus paridis TaxID=2803862 RepID=A0ABS1TTZ2_9BACI|nr:hypothetical protein [Neobacillus paridis]MBL4954785.1 hypothetical protein [Neobacillus paridis]